MNMNDAIDVSARPPRLLLSEPCFDYMYTFACQQEEEGLCRLEQRVLFGEEVQAPGWIRSQLCLEPGRSPFIRQRLVVRYEADTLEELIIRVDGRTTGEGTFKLRFVKLPDSCSYEEQRLVEKRVGAVLKGKADVKNPGLVLGIAEAGGRWLLGELADNDAQWLKHQSKPQSYSTALGTRVARAAVNIALPYSDAELRSKSLLDPCCGMGTVLVEARSMGIEAVGSDLNPLAVRGARVNLAYFGYSDAVTIRDIAKATGRYDAVLIDLPYNLCSVSSREEQLAILKHACRLSTRAVLVTTEEIGDLLEAAGLTVTDRCEIPKGRLVRQVLLCSVHDDSGAPKNS